MLPLVVHLPIAPSDSPVLSWGHFADTRRRRHRRDAEETLLRFLERERAALDAVAGFEIGRGSVVSRIVVTGDSGFGMQHDDVPLVVPGLRVLRVSGPARAAEIVAQRYRDLATASGASVRVEVDGAGTRSELESGEAEVWLGPFGEAFVRSRDQRGGEWVAARLPWPDVEQP